MEENRKVLVDNLNKYLRMKGKKRSEMATELNIPTSLLYGWFSGVSYPRIENMERIAEYLGVTITQLVGEGRNTAPEFTVVNGKLKSYKNYGKKKSELNFVLTGKMFCGHCGKSMHGITAKGRWGGRHGYYTCANKCMGYEKKIHLEELVASAIAQSILEPAHRDEIIDDIVDQTNKLELHITNEIDALRRSIANTKKKLNHLLNAVKQGIISPTLQEELTALEQQIEMYNLEISKKKMQKKVDVDIDKLYYFFEQLYKQRNTAQGVEFIIKHFVRKVTLWNDRMTVHFDITGKTPIEKTVEFNDEGVIKSATHLHQLMRYNNPTGYLSHKVYVYGYHVFITVVRLPNSKG